MVTTITKARTFQPKQQKQEDIWHTKFPVDVTWGVYARQSTVAQMLRSSESTEMQTEDLLAWLVAKGVPYAQWELFDEDLGVSGQLRIDQRTGLQQLVDRINKNVIKAVLVYQVSRLFRDQTGVQYNVFANICKEHNCVLVTSDGMIFNFQNPMHVKMFRFLAEMAAEYIPQQIGLLHAARIRKARKGIFVGIGAVPIGFIVDYDKYSPTYRKFIPYEPHARVIRWIYRRYYELEGNFQALMRELHDIPVLFPSFGKDVDNRCVTKCLVRKVPGGYHLSRPGLIELLTNPAYLGWWIVEGDVVSRENHEAIIPQEEEYLFWYAFNRLSPYTTEGKENMQRVTSKRQRFFQKTTQRQAGLLKGKITAPEGQVYVHLAKGCDHYCICPTPTAMVKVGIHEIEGRIIDDAFSKRFFERLMETHDFDEYQRFLAEETKKQESLVSSIMEQLAEIERQQEAILDDKLAIRAHINQQVRETLAKDPTASVDELKARFEEEAAPDLERLRKRAAKHDALTAELKAKLPTVEENEQFKTARTFTDFQTETRKLIPVWHNKPFAIRKEFVDLFVEEAVLQLASPHWIALTIVWSHPAWETDTLFIYRWRGDAAEWPVEDIQVVRELYPTEKKETLLSLLPDKSWGAIQKEAIKLGVNRFAKPDRSLHLPWELTWADWQFMQAEGIGVDERDTKCVTTSARYCRRWPRCTCSS